jgi:hypothetical protein
MRSETYALRPRTRSVCPFGSMSRATLGEWDSKQRSLLHRCARRRTAMRTSSPSKVCPNQRTDKSHTKTHALLWLKHPHHPVDSHSGQLLPVAAPSDMCDWLR